MKKSIEFSSSNLHLEGKGRDTNGNKIVKVSFPNVRAFSIQTNHNLPHTHKTIFEHKKISDIPKEDLEIIFNEINDYVKTHGSKLQKEKLKLYETREIPDVNYEPLIDGDGDEVSGKIKWNTFYKKFQTEIDGTIYEEFDKIGEAKNYMEKAGFKTIISPSFKEGGKITGAGKTVIVTINKPSKVLYFAASGTEIIEDFFKKGEGVIGKIIEEDNGIYAIAAPDGRVFLVNISDVESVKEPKVFKLGDMWSNDFDYDGMFEYALRDDVNENTSIATLEKLFNSFEDVNYHTVSAPLWDAIVLLKQSDKEAATKKIQEFKELLKKEQEYDGDVFELGGKVGLKTVEISGIRKNIMGTTSFDMKVEGWRKPQDFIVYPINQPGQEYITIQSGKKFGKIRVSDGSGVTSKSGSSSIHLQVDMAAGKIDKIQLSKDQLNTLLEAISKTAGKSVGTSVVKSDNSGAALLRRGGTIKSKRGWKQDRLWTSDEAHEQYYKQSRKSKVKSHKKDSKLDSQEPHEKSRAAKNKIFGFFANGGVIVSRKFTESDFEKMAGEQFNTNWNDVWNIKDKSGNIHGFWNPEMEMLVVVGKTDKSNLLVKYLMDNGMLSTDEIKKFKAGGTVSDNTARSVFNRYFTTEEAESMLFTLSDANEMTSVDYNSTKDNGDTIIVIHAYTDRKTHLNPYNLEMGNSEKGRFFLLPLKPKETLPKQLSGEYGGSIDGYFESSADYQRRMTKDLSKQDREAELVKKIKKSAWSSEPILESSGMVKVYADIYDLSPKLVAELFNKHQRTTSGETSKSKAKKFLKTGGQVEDNNNQVAVEILKQLGGMGRLKIMTGAHNFVALKNGVSFKIKNPKANYIKITLTSMDLYDLEIGQVRGGKYKEILKKEGLYDDMLKPAIESGTGMYLSFKEGGIVEDSEWTDVGDGEFDNWYDFALHVQDSEEIQKQHPELYKKTLEILKEQDKLYELVGDDDNPFNPHVHEFINLETEYLKHVLSLKNLKFKHGGKVGKAKKEKVLHDKNVTHFAINRNSGKIINAWNYKGYDKDDLNDDKEWFFFYDLREDFDTKKKDAKIVTRKQLDQMGIDPENIDNWHRPTLGLGGLVLGGLFGAYVGYKVGKSQEKSNDVFKTEKELKAFITARKNKAKKKRASRLANS